MRSANPASTLEMTPAQKRLEFWVRVAIYSAGTIFLCGLLWLQDITKLADTAGHAPVPATIVSMARVARGKQTVTRATVNYHPDAGAPCRVDVDLAANTPLRPGQAFLLLPRKLACYEPVPVEDLGDPRLPLSGVALGVAGLAVSALRMRQFRKA